MSNPETVEELSEFIEEQLKRNLGYSDSAEALHDIALAAFNLAARSLGNTGFQASYAALKLLGSVNCYSGPYGVIKAEDMLFPQYPPPEVKAREMAEGWKEWVREEAAKKLEEEKSREDGFSASPRVIAHWEGLVNNAS